MSRPLSVTIDQQALRDNLATVRRIAPYSNIWSVIKANAYGHGIIHVLRPLSEADGFALRSIEEAVLLRENNWKKPILLLEGFFHEKDLELIDHYRLTVGIHSKWQISALAKSKLSAPIDVYLKVNSGMNRLGFPLRDVMSVWESLRFLQNVGSIIIMAHFADTKDSQRLIKDFYHLKCVTEKLNCLCSFSNSACILWHPEISSDWVRPGIILYGASPSGNYDDIVNIGIKPVMTFTSKIIGVQKIIPGNSVGYGNFYVANQSQKIGIVACGYADGYPRHVPSGSPIVVEGVRTKIIGNVSMDMIAVDLNCCSFAKIGSKVELWGECLKIDEVAESAKTISYDLMCGISSNIPINII